MEQVRTSDGDLLSPSAVPGPRAPAPFSLGVEEQLLLVDPDTHRPLAAVAGPPRRPGLGRGRVLRQPGDAVVELRTPACATVAEAGQSLGDLRARVAAWAPAALLGAGLHPAAGGAGPPPAGACVLRIHVGMPDADTALVARRGLRRWAPLLHALAANSAVVDGRDSGLASARAALPAGGAGRSGVRWQDAIGTAPAGPQRPTGPGAPAPAAPGDASGEPVRAHPRLGTVEIGGLDAQSRLEDAVAIVALTHCLAVHEAECPGARPPGDHVLADAWARAGREGLDARLPFADGTQPARALLRIALHAARGHAGELGCRDELDLVWHLLRGGTGAERQRRAFARGGASAVLRDLIAATHPPAAARHEVA